MKILIVDDERIERDGIRFLIETHNIDLAVEEAENGEKALDIIRNNSVDILFTDIKMPLMGGLELVAKARILNPDLKVILFSAYSEFEYAREAIKLDVDYYILKPINVDEFVKTMSEVILACKEQQLKKKNEEVLLQVYQKVKVYETEKILLDILSGTTPDHDIEVTIHNGAKGMALKDIRIVLLDFRDRFFDSSKLDFGRYLDYIIKCDFCTVNINEYQTIILMQETNGEKSYLESIGRQLADAIKCHYNKDVCIVFSRKIAEMKDIHTEYMEVDSLAEYKFFYKGSVILFAGESMYNENTIPESVDMKQKSASISEKYKGAVAEVIDIIRKEYALDISLEYLAEKVFLSPSYLSYLFRKVTGQSTIKYITNYRLEEAKKLLTDTNMKIVDISRSVGYLNTSYFCSLFKNYYGTPPGQYRERTE